MQKNFGTTKKILNYELRGSGCMIGPYFWGISKVKGLPWELHQTTSPWIKCPWHTFFAWNLHIFMHLQYLKMVRLGQENPTEKGRQGQAKMPHLAAAHTKVPWVCASLWPGFPACPGAQTSLRFLMLEHDKEIAQQSRPQHRATPILMQQLAMGVGMGRSSALVYNESCKILHLCREWIT